MNGLALLVIIALLALLIMLAVNHPWIGVPLILLLGVWIYSAWTETQHAASGRRGGRR